MDLAPLLRRALDRPLRDAQSGGRSWQPSPAERLALLQPTALLPADEPERLAALRELHLLDPGAD
ncbi:MAG: hypothetical protein ACXWC6_14200, partial [Ramlibacter sp.]